MSKVCVICKKAPALDDICRCEACRERQKAAYRKRYYGRKAKGLCTQCGKPAEDGRTKCREHLDIQNEWSKNYYYKWYKTL